MNPAFLDFGAFIRARRLALASGPDGHLYSIRRVAKEVGLQASHLSKVERGLETAIIEDKIVRLAEKLDLNPDLLLARAGKVSLDLREQIIRRPQFFAGLIRQLKDAPDDALFRLVREVRDGEWGAPPRISPKQETIVINNDQLEIACPEVHPEARLIIEFQRTLRIPDDDRTYPLPPGLGRFPVKHTNDYAKQLPEAWSHRGGVMFPMHQSEAMWLNFDSPSGYPFAVKVAAGLVDAVTGDPWADGLEASPQNYIPVPEQPWLDGFCVSKGVIRQFVAMPLGSGYSTEEQITGEAQFGGLQLEVFPLKAEFYRPGRAEIFSSMVAEDLMCFSAAPDMSLAPGGSMRQEIYQDQRPVSDYDLHNRHRCYVHLCNSLVWRKLTGENPPTSPPTADEYNRHGYPWFDFYSETPAVDGGTELRKLKSVATIGKEQSETPFLENGSVAPKKIISISHDQPPPGTWDKAAIDRLRECFSHPPEQGPVGQPPSSYISILNDEIDHTSQRCDGTTTKQLTTLHPYAVEKCTRIQIRSICNDPDVDVLEAYAAVMAWGGQHRRWFRNSIKHHVALRQLLCYLRGSAGTRAHDFGIAHRASESIKGLGISYFSKLLFSFRTESDAYILDQWTAKSVHVLTRNVIRLSQWGGPDPSTTPADYEDFCSTLETLGHLLGGWTGEQIEQALFDQSGGCWRNWIKGGERGRTTKSQSPSVQAAAVGTQTLPQRIQELHHEFAECRTPLPPGDPTGNIHRNGSIQLQGGRGIEWVYEVTRKCVKCKVNLVGDAGNMLLDELVAANGGGMLFRNGAKGRKNNAASNIYLRTTKVSDVWDEDPELLAAEAVETMSKLWVAVHGAAKDGRIDHPFL